MEIVDVSGQFYINLMRFNTRLDLHNTIILAHLVFCKAWLCIITIKFIQFIIICQALSNSCITKDNVKTKHHKICFQDDVL